MEWNYTHRLILNQLGSEEVKRIDVQMNSDFDSVYTPNKINEFSNKINSDEDEGEKFFYSTSISDLIYDVTIITFVKIN